MAQEQRFGWLTKRDIRLRLLRDTLNELNANLVAELGQEQHKREVRVARVFMDAFVDAKKEDKNALSAAYAALQRNGFRRTDTQYSRGSIKRDREVREMEAALMKQIEAARTPDESEQLVMSKEFDLTNTYRKLGDCQIKSRSLQPLYQSSTMYALWCIIWTLGEQSWQKGERLWLT